jgi:hypothetical protein
MRDRNHIVGKENENLPERIEEDKRSKQRNYDKREC